jgi:putative DNA primase/helicase
LVRCLNIPARREYGTWDDLHGFKDGAKLSDAVVAAAETHYGHAGRAFSEKLTRDKRDWQAHYDAFKAMSEFTVGGADGQVKRAASKFALVAMAGELAIEYDVVPWPNGDAIKAAAEMFDAWRAGRGTVAKR